MFIAAGIIGWLVLGYATAFIMIRFLKLDPKDEEDRFYTVVSVFLWPIFAIFIVAAFVSDVLKKNKISLFRTIFFIKEDK